ncbi:MAG: aminoglycoside phosphotransferase family protein [Aromatoleum sp.]|nr:aminoglycoside phosphotransferase family protein [Aromatoleum sp.]
MTPTGVRSAPASPAPGSDELARALVRMGIVGAHQPMIWTPLAGGVSSDIYRVELPMGVICVKRALAKLKVAADWRAPVERNRSEVEWMRVAGRIVPAAVPAILGEDREAGAFAMAWLPPKDYPVWKTLLASGTIDVPTAAAVGALLGRIHAATADRPDLAARFDTDAIFYPIRLEPYLVATGRTHADLAPHFAALVETTRTTKRVLVHGDFSPKNLLIGAQGPVILDAECAWYGDPAFDLAFVLNHLLLKGAWRPAWRLRYTDAFVALTDAYLAQVSWEPPAEIEARTAALLPGLMLARIDGKSPVEYLTGTAEKHEVRRFARALLFAPTPGLAAIAARWAAGATR